MAQLGVNIDHVATIRQARYRGQEFGPITGDEPDPVHAAYEAELGGADIITVHLREDRRHITDRDVEIVARTVRTRLNLEMAATDEMVGICIRVKAHSAALVPEGRNEVTTEGGLDVAGQLARITGVVSRLHEAGIKASAFIDAEERQIEAARSAGFDICEIHTGPYARAFAMCGGDPTGAELWTELDRVERAGSLIRAAGMRFNVGHALNYSNVGLLAALPGIGEAHIGHSIVSRAVFSGMRRAVAEMKALLAAGGRGRGG
jgi:pyridoxine 5-phosphate synthase